MHEQTNKNINHILRILLLLYSWMVGVGNFQLLAIDNSLFQAISQGNLKEVAAAVATGVSLNQLDAYGGTPLHWAVYKGELAMAKWLLEGGGDMNAMVNPHFPLENKEALESLKQHYIKIGADISDLAHCQFLPRKEKLLLYNYYGTPLHIAVAKGNRQMATLLLAHGAVLNSHLWDGPLLQSYATPLEIAVRHGDIALVKWLLKQGAPVNDSDPIEGLTILDAALSSDYNMFKLLIDHGARVNAKTAYGYLMDFARHNMLQEIRELLIEQGAHFDLFPLDHAKNTDTCQNTVTCLLENGASLHTKDKENHTLLHAAVRKKPRCGCEHNLDDDLWENNYTKNNACVPVDHTVQRNRAWLHAICKGDLKKVEEGIAAGISVNQLTQKGTVPLHIEVYMGYIKNPYAKLRITYGYTPLHLAAYQGNTALVKLLLQKGANSNAKDTQHGYTPLHLAACQGHAQAVERLLAHNALINVKEKRLERTPLHLAAATGNSATVRHLINHGALHSIDKHNWTPLHVAIASRNATAVIKLLIDKGDVLDKTELDKTEDTLLHFATKEKAIAAMRYLIQKGANVNATNAAGNTALHFAAKSHMLEGCKLLIAAGAEVDHANKKGKTPLYMACGDNYNGVLVEFLIQKGINVNHKNKNGKTALQLAIQNNLHSDIITLLGSKADRGRQPLEVQPFTFFNTSFFKALVKKNTEKEDKKTKKSNIAPTVTQ